MVGDLVVPMVVQMAENWADMKDENWADSSVQMKVVS